MRQWLHSIWRREYGWRWLLGLLLLGAGWCWPDLCVNRAAASLAQRETQMATWWLRAGGRLRLLRSSSYCLVESRLARREGRYIDVANWIRLAAAAGAAPGEVSREQWLAQAQTGQYAEMESHWADLLADPRDDEPEIARSYVTSALERHDIDNALLILRIWEQDYPKDPEPHAAAGMIYQASHAWKLAEDRFREALRRAPTHWVYRRSLANAVREQLRLDEAVGLYQECLRDHPDDLETVRGLAQTLASQGEMEQARNLLAPFAERAPENLDLQRTYGEVLLAAGDHAWAAGALRPVYAAQPEDANLAYSFGLALKGSGAVDEAEPLLNFAAESRPHVGKLKHLQEQLREHPQNLEIRLQIAEISAKYRSRKEGIRWYESALPQVPNNREIHAALARLYRQTGDNAAAARHERFLPAAAVSPPTTK